MKLGVDLREIDDFDYLRNPRLWEERRGVSGEKIKKRFTENNRSKSGGGRWRLRERAVTRELMDQFEAAEAWLAPMRP